MRIEFPWPDHALHPNARPHWAQKAKAVKAQRNHWFALARWHGCEAQTQPAGYPRSLTITFCPRTRHEQDVDGCLASIKAGLDGLADALRVNDSTFRLAPIMGDPVKGGTVIVEWLD
jgi:crossover junction endodeoxyribonuclease RusA